MKKSTRLPGTLKYAVYREGHNTDFYKTREDAERACRQEDSDAHHTHAYVMHVKSVWK